MFWLVLFQCLDCCSLCCAWFIHQPRTGLWGPGPDRRGHKNDQVRDLDGQGFCLWSWEWQPLPFAAMLLNLIGTVRTCCFSVVIAFSTQFLQLLCCFPALLIAFDCLGPAEAAREGIVLPALPWQLATASTAQRSCHQLMGALIEHVYVEVCVKCLCLCLCLIEHVYVWLKCLLAILSAHLRWDPLGHGRPSRVESWSDDTKDWLLKTVSFFMDPGPDEAPPSEATAITEEAATGSTGNKVTWLKNVVAVTVVTLFLIVLLWLIGLGQAWRDVASCLVLLGPSQSWWWSLRCDWAALSAEHDEVA